MKISPKVEDTISFETFSEKFDIENTILVKVYEKEAWILQLHVNDRDFVTAYYKPFKTHRLLGNDDDGLFGWCNTKRELKQKILDDIQLKNKGNSYDASFYIFFSLNDLIQMAVQKGWK